jgi:hypothetical protein
MRRRTLCTVLVLGILASSTPAWAQPSQTRPRSLKAGIAGLFIMGAGMGLMSAPGETYTLLGDDFCVTEREVKSGGCSRSPGMRGVGAAVLATGAVITLVGFSRVQVSPTYKGAKATMTLTW